MFEPIIRLLNATAAVQDRVTFLENPVPTAMDHSSFRDLLIFSIGLVIERNRTLLRRILKEHVSD